MHFGYVDTPGSNAYNLLVLTRADGTGEIDVLAANDADDYDAEFYLPASATWTPDGGKMFVDALNRGQQRLFEFELDTRRFLVFGNLQGYAGPTLYD